MKKHLHWSLNTPETEVPARLDAQILLAAALQAKRLRRTRRNRIFLSSAAALIAVTLSIYAVAFPVRRPATAAPTEQLTRSELLSLVDWTNFEQESYAVNSSCEEFQELSSNFEDTLI